MHSPITHGVTPKPTLDLVGPCSLFRPPSHLAPRPATTAQCAGHHGPLSMPAPSERGQAHTCSGHLSSGAPQSTAALATLLRPQRPHGQPLASPLLLHPFRCSDQNCYQELTPVLPGTGLQGASLASKAPSAETGQSQNWASSTCMLESLSHLGGEKVYDSKRLWREDK